MMTVNGIPTILLLQPSRLGIADGQKRLAEAQSEAATGRHHDVGLTLGAHTGTDIKLRLQLSTLERSASGMKQAALAADSAQDALAAMSSLADRFRSSLVGASTSQNGRGLNAALAVSALDSMQSSMSLTTNGKYLFSGLATDTPPLTAYNDGPRQALLDAFQAEFGILPQDPAASALTADDVSSFIDDVFSSFFSGTGWTSTWSAASSDRPKFRLQSGERIDLSTTANMPFAQKLAQAFALMEVFGDSKVNATAFDAVSARSIALVSEAQVAIGDEQATIGIGQARLREDRANLDQRTTRITAAVSALESVDPYEAATRVNLLMTQLESSYALTSRISRISLLSYL
jgi:flagellar hook-associated protein 3 FlgL